MLKISGLENVRISFFKPTRENSYFQDDLYSTNSQVLMYYEHEKIDASTDPLIDDNSVNQGMKNLINDDGVDESNVYTETEGSNVYM